MKKILLMVFLTGTAGCAFDASDWAPSDEGLEDAVRYCRTETLQRDPLLGPFWYGSKDFRPCMENKGYFKQ